MCADAASPATAPAAGASLHRRPASVPREPRVLAGQPLVGDPRVARGRDRRVAEPVFQVRERLLEGVVGVFERGPPRVAEGGAGARVVELRPVRPVGGVREAVGVGKVDHRVLLGAVRPGGAEVDRRGPDVRGPGAAADPVARLEHGDRNAGVVQRAGRGEARRACAHDEDVGVGVGGGGIGIDGGAGEQEQHRNDVARRGASRFMSRSRSSLDPRVEPAIREPDRQSASMGLASNVQDPKQAARIEAFKQAFETLGVRAMEREINTTLAGTVKAMSERIVRLGGPPRPAAAPSYPGTTRLLGEAIRKPAPVDPLDAPEHVAAFLPDFLRTMAAERPTSSQPLTQGMAIPDSDVMLGIADLFAEVQRSLIEWENILGKAESADLQVDRQEELEEDRDEAAYDASLTTYNVRRKDGIAAAERSMKLTSLLQFKFNSLSKTEQAKALKESNHV
jgi:hypothetical protein